MTAVGASSAPATAMDGVVSGGLVLTPSGTVDATLSFTGGVITAVVRAGDIGETGGRNAPRAAHVLDAEGALVVPGIVDLHGDAFERSLMPRPGVAIDPPTALVDNDRQMLAAGITTAYLAATDSWEPGLRSRVTLRALIAALAATPLAVDTRLHVRHELTKTDDHDELVGWISGGVVALLSLNDHNPLPDRPGSVDDLTRYAIGRSGVSAEELHAAMTGASRTRDLASGQVAELAGAASAAGVVLASHDTSSTDELARDLRLGVTIAEFPTTVELALRTRRAGVAVLFGAPNMVRGGSHLGYVGAADAVLAGAADALCSDYHYPSLLQAPFVVGRDHGLALVDAWELVAAAPAAMAGLDDRGRLEPGRRADVVVVEPPEGIRPARVRDVLVGGRHVFSAP